MIRLLCVGDGERDAVTVPRLLEHILGVAVEEKTTHWPRLHREVGNGYCRQLLFVSGQARDAEVHGVVASVDRDKDRKNIKLRALRAARKEQRDQGNDLPVALGEAIPHGEAWLLDDPVAVRKALRLSPDARVPTVRRTKNPKATLTELWKQGGRAGDRLLEVLADIARQVDPSRCQHAGETGFEAFADDARSEFSSLSPNEAAT